MSISAMKQALEALALVARSDEWQGCQTYEGQIATSAHEALRQTIAEAEKQDSARVGEVGVWGDKHEWVGLTDEERGMVVNANFGVGVWEMARAIEAKLKEKNMKYDHFSSHTTITQERISK